MKLIRTLAATVGSGVLVLLASCASSAPEATATAVPSSSPAAAHFAAVTSDWQITSPGTADQVVHPAPNCSLDASNRQTCVPQPDRVAAGSPPTYAAHAVVRNDGSAPGTVSVTLGAAGTTCSVTTAVTNNGSTSEVSCEIGTVADPGIPPQVTVQNR